MKDSDFKKVPITKLTAIPENNGFYELRKNYYWVVTEDDCVLFYKGSSPQCNSSKAVVDNWGIKRDVFKNSRTMLIENAWMPHDCSDYR
jgi:hypothetical protein